MRRCARGFTLIEILLVLVIIGCAVGIVVLSLPGGPGQSASRDMGVEAERLRAAIQLAGEQAVMEGRIIGLRIEPRGYQFLVRASQPPSEADLGAVDEGRWVPYEQGKFPSAQQFPEAVTLSLELGGLALQSEENHLGRSQPAWIDPAPGEGSQEPQIYLLPGGEMTPFQLILRAQQGGEEFYREIRAEESGQVTLLTRQQAEAGQ